MAYLIKLLNKRTIANGTMAFEWEKPAGYTFTSGQATDWTIPNPAETDDEGNLRSFSIACGPNEPLLRIATRMRDTAFKRCLSRMNLGDTISIDDPWGEFTLEAAHTSDVVFLCGGIGVTPFYSMLLDHVAQQRTQHVTLFFSNKTIGDAPFRNELLALAKKNSAITMVETITDDPDWQGEHGFIDEAMLKRHISDLNVPTYYIAGPPQMVAAMNKMLHGAGIAEEQIKLDEFSGY